MVLGHDQNFFAMVKPQFWFVPDHQRDKLDQLDPKRLDEASGDLQKVLKFFFKNIFYLHFYLLDG